MLSENGLHCAATHTHNLTQRRPRTSQQSTYGHPCTQKGATHAPAQARSRSSWQRMFAQPGQDRSLDPCLEALLPLDPSMHANQGETKEGKRAPLSISLA